MSKVAEEMLVEQSVYCAGQLEAAILREDIAGTVPMVAGLQG